MFTTITVDKPVVSTPPIQVLSLESCVALFKRSYNCQQSGLELFYRVNGQTTSLYLFFTEMVVYWNLIDV